MKPLRSRTMLLQTAFPRGKLSQLAQRRFPYLATEDSCMNRLTVPIDSISPACTVCMGADAFTSDGDLPPAFPRPLIPGHLAG
jgi:hypothetical protein